MKAVIQNISLRRINSNRIAKLKCRQIYLKAFPANERAPFMLLSIKARMDSVDFWGIYRDKTLIGFFYVVRDSDLAYIFYFAIAEKERENGFGSAALQKLKKEYSSMRLFLASEEIDPEAPNLDERIKRKNFYLNNGFEDLHTKIQEGSVMFEALGVGGSIMADEYRRLMVKWMGKRMSRRITLEMQDG